jgi:HEAT repeat protein
MATLRQFNIGLYREHLAEASFLDGQRSAHLRDPEVNWPSLRDLEERLEAHLDALVVGGALALETCRTPPSDPGEMHAALCVFCRQDLPADAIAALNAVDPADETAVSAASRALRNESPATWREHLLRLLQRDQPPLTPIVARVAGFRRYPAEELLVRALGANPDAGRADLAWALGRIGSARCVPTLWSLMAGDDERTCEAAALALLRLGDERVLARVMAAAPVHAWARRILGMAGGARSVPLLLQALAGTGAGEDTVLALGLLGDLSAVAPLLQLLDDETLGPSAAVALNTITGAGLYANTFVADAFDPDELFDDEREAFERDGTLPTRGGEPYGNWERGPLRDRVGWQAWLTENKHRFSRDHRWRMGEAYGPSALVACLKCESTPHSIRSAAYEELVARYGLDVPFEVELRVRQQMQFLAKIEHWSIAQANRFEPGRWYLAGQLQA